MRLVTVLLVLIGLPAFEIFLFVEIGSRIGAWPTVGLMLAAMALGIALIRYQGILTLVRVREAVMRGEAPALAMLEGLMMLVSGFLFLVPGFLTDALALLGLIPPLRRALINKWLGHAHLRPGPGSGPRTYEGECRREDDPRLR